MTPGKAERLGSPLLEGLAPPPHAQWRLYGGGGHGYAVELDPSIRLMPVIPGLRAHAETLADEDGSSDGQEPGEFVDVTPWLHVLYTEEQKSTALAGLVQAADRQLKRIEKASVQARWDQGGYCGIREAHDAQIAMDLARLTQLMKSDGFSGAHEARVLVVDQFASRPDLAAQFRATPFGVVRYARLSAPTAIFETSGLCRRWRENAPHHGSAARTTDPRKQQ